LLHQFFLLACFLPLACLPPARGGEAGDTESPVVRAVRSYIAATTPWLEEEIEVLRVEGLNGAALPADAAGCAVVQKNPPTTFKNLILPVECSSAGGPRRTFWVVAQISIRARVVLAARRLAFGSAIGAEDVIEETTLLSDPRQVYLRSSSEALGRLLRRPLSPGDPLTRESVTEPLLVRSGDSVRLTLERGLVRLAARGRAEQNGRIHEVIRVRNLDFSSTVLARITGRGEVRIE